MRLAEIEKELNIKFPEKWWEIYAAGSMNWMELSHEEFYPCRKDYIETPSSFLMLNCDCEPLLFEDIMRRIEDLNEWISWREEDEELVLSDSIRLIPFAQTGSGDLYCFLYSECNADPKIILYLHDIYDDPDIVADTFDEFFYIMMLDAAASGENINNSHWKVHLSFLDEKYRNMLLGKTACELADVYYSLTFKKASIWR